MATTAPGSPYVESSDLVANYPAVSEALAERVDTVGVLPFATSTARGTAIPSPTEGQYTYLQDTNATEYWDGSAWVAAGAAPGLVHINTTTFTAQSSVSINNAFTSDYDDYAILLSHVGSTSAYIAFRMRAAGTDNSASLYSYSAWQYRYNGTTLISWNGATQNNAYIGELKTARTHEQLILMSPQLALPTFATGSGGDIGGAAFNTFGALHDVGTSYDGITFLATTGTMTGTVRIYGYKNS